MKMPKPLTYVFNEGRSQTVLRYAPINAAWMVFREDGLTTPKRISGNIRIHNSYDEAKRDYDNRVAAIQFMDALEDEQVDKDSYDESDEAIWNNEAALEQGRFQ